MHHAVINYLSSNIMYMMQMAIKRLLTFRCKKECGKHGKFDFFGVGPGDNCFCMKKQEEKQEEPKLKVKTKDCNEECSGDKSKLCGGWLPGKISLMNVWRNGMY